MRLIKAYKFSKPSFVMISGDNDIKLLKNAFKRNGYIFWSYTLDAILEMRSIQNFVSDVKKIKRN